MTRLLFFCLGYLAGMFMALAIVTYADDGRYHGGQVMRDGEGRIARSTDVIAAFKREHPCPTNKKTYGPCPGWAIDHVIPLACGGRDEIENMQWLPNQIKSSSGKYPKDRWERKVYCK